MLVESVARGQTTPPAQLWLEGVAEVITPTTGRVTETSSLGTGVQNRSCNVHEHRPFVTLIEEARHVLGTRTLRTNARYEVGTRE